MALLIGACADPPPPPPARPATRSVARWMEWRAANEPVRGPVVVVVDHAGGAVDSIVADADVTTFFNDRFHPLFRDAFPGQPSGTLRFYDGCGCPLGPPLTPASPTELIASANELIVSPDWRRCQGRPFPDTCSPPVGPAE